MYSCRPIVLEKLLIAITAATSLLGTGCGREAEMRNASEVAFIERTDALTSDYDVEVTGGGVHSSDVIAVQPTPTPSVIVNPLAIEAEEYEWQTSSFSLGVGTQQVSSDVSVALVIDNSGSMAPAMNTLVAGLQQLLTTDAVTYPNINFLVTNSTVNITEDIEYYEEVGGQLVKRDQRPDVGIKRRIPKISDPLAQQFQIKEGMSKGDVQGVFDDIIDYVKQMGTDGSSDELGVCKLLRMKDQWIKKGEPFGAFVLTNEDELPSNENSDWHDTCDLAYRDVPYTLSRIPITASCNPSTEVCDRTEKRTYQVRVKRGVMSLWYYEAEDNDGAISYTQKKTYLNENQCGSHPDRCEASEPCTAAQVDYLESKYRSTFISCESVEQVSYLTTVAYEQEDRCSNPVTIEGVTYDNVTDYFEKKGHIVEANSCSSYMRQIYTKRTVFEYERTKTPEKKRILDRGDDGKGDLVESLAEEFIKLTNDQFFFVSGIRDQELDKAESCGNESNYSYGLNFARLVDYLGMRGLSFSLCKNSYQNALTQLADFIDTVVTSFSYDVEAPGEDGQLTEVVILDKDNNKVKIDPNLVKVDGTKVTLDPKLQNKLPQGAKITGKVKYKVKVEKKDKETKDSEEEKDEDEEDAKDMARDRMDSDDSDDSDDAVG